PWLSVAVLMSCTTSVSPESHPWGETNLSQTESRRFPESAAARNAMSFSRARLNAIYCDSTSAVALLQCSIVVGA
ncbi:MAG: hypothetical protein ACK5Q5_05115, partial [Planctomycetaceae bacterium]